MYDCSIEPWLPISCRIRVTIASLKSVMIQDLIKNGNVHAANNYPPAKLTEGVGFSQIPRHLLRSLQPRGPSGAFLVWRKLTLHVALVKRLGILSTELISRIEIILSYTARSAEGGQCAWIGHFQRLSPQSTQSKHDLPNFNSTVLGETLVVR